MTRYLLSHILHTIGDLISRIPYWYPYGIYNWCMIKSSAVQGDGRGPWSRAFGQEPGKSYVLGYMCGVDWECELGMASGGNTVYPSGEDCEKRRKCTEQCGIVEVKVYFSKWIKEQNLIGDGDEA